jgi:hypothetical protein
MTLVPLRNPPLALFRQNATRSEREHPAPSRSESVGENLRPPLALLGRNARSVHGRPPGSTIRKHRRDVGGAVGFVSPNAAGPTARLVEPDDREFVLWHNGGHPPAQW